MSKFDDVDLSEFLGTDEFVTPPPEDLGAGDADLIGPAGMGTNLGKAPSIDAPPVDPEELKSRIAGYYINKQLEESILRHGSIPEYPAETTIGVGFIDIADYSYISNWLSPRENQVFLNGLYSAFHHVLKKRGGYLNKISGDSMMFHFGGIIDPLTKGMPLEEVEPLIARLLFLTCMEIQESCRLFNRADEDFIPANAPPSAKKSIRQAFSIMRNLRENLSLMTGIDAMFQVRIRIGAGLGGVCIGNFGPEGARQWDVVGVPVIEARRMESSAPVDGIRITKKLYTVLAKTGLVKQYLEHFRSRASGFYQGITSNELFDQREVVLKDKKNVTFESCAIQANPDLPEDIWRQVESNFEMGEAGIPTIMDVLRYYRGNRLVIGAVEEFFHERGVRVRKAAVFKLLAPQNYRKLLDSRGGSEEEVETIVESRLPLHKLLTLLGAWQDRAKSVEDGKAKEEEAPFGSHDEWLSARLLSLAGAHQAARKRDERERYFEQVLLPSVFAYIEAALREKLLEGKASDDREGNPIDHPKPAVKGGRER